MQIFWASGLFTETMGKTRFYPCFWMIWGIWRTKNAKTDVSHNINLPYPLEYMNVLQRDLDFHTTWEPEFKLIPLKHLETKRFLLTQVFLHPRIWEVAFLLGSEICIASLSFLINFVNLSGPFVTWVLSSSFQSFCIIHSFICSSILSLIIIIRFLETKHVIGNKVIAKNTKLNNIQFPKMLMAWCGN